MIAAVLVALVGALLAFPVPAGAKASKSTTTTSTTTTSTTTTTIAPAPAAPAAPVPPLTDATGVPLGITPPVIGAVPAGAHAILAVGDSDLAQGVFSLPDVLARHGFDTPIYDAHGNGWGLLDPLQGVPALDVLSQQLGAHPDVDTVVIGFVGACVFACGPALPYGSQQFYDAWDAAAHDLVAVARSRGLQVVWAVSPPAPPPESADPPVEDWFSLPMRHQVAVTLAAHARTYASKFGIATTDWTQALSDTSGQWQPDLSYGGGVHTVRLDDKVHLTEEGSIRASGWTMATLAQLWNRPQTKPVP